MYAAATPPRGPRIRMRHRGEHQVVARACRAGAARRIEPVSSPPVSGASIDLSGSPLGGHLLTVPRRACPRRSSLPAPSEDHVLLVLAEDVPHRVGDLP